MGSAHLGHDVIRRTTRARLDLARTSTVKTVHKEEKPSESKSMPVTLDEWVWGVIRDTENGQN